MSYSTSPAMLTEFRWTAQSFRPSASRLIVVGRFVALFGAQDTCQRGRDDQVGGGSASLSVSVARGREDWIGMPDCGDLLGELGSR